ncbi:MAG: hypothetical protein HY521_02150 [Proteobacteria bacterium]|nr:hypothetical protein [Pseudomonadota bacterium]
MAENPKPASAEEIGRLIRAAGLSPTDDEMAGLLDAQPQVEAKARLVRARIGRFDEPANVYGLAPER